MAIVVSFAVAFAINRIFHRTMSLTQSISVSNASAVSRRPSSLVWQTRPAADLTGFFGYFLGTAIPAHGYSVRSRRPGLDVYRHVARFLSIASLAFTYKGKGDARTKHLPRLNG